MTVVVATDCVSVTLTHVSAAALRGCGVLRFGPYGAATP